MQPIVFLNLVSNPGAVKWGSVAIKRANPHLRIHSSELIIIEYRRNFQKCYLPICWRPLEFCTGYFLEGSLKNFGF